MATAKRTTVKATTKATPAKATPKATTTKATTVKTTKTAAPRTRATKVTAPKVTATTSAPRARRAVARPTIDATPVLAAIGLGEVAVEKGREALGTAAASRRKLAKDVMATPARVRDRAKGLPQGLAQAPAEVTGQVEQALGRVVELAAAAVGKAEADYRDLAKRGGRLVKAARTRPETKQLLAQVDQTVAAGKGAVTVARKSVAETQAQAKATLTTGRTSAVRVAGAATAAATKAVKATSSDLTAAAESVAHTAATEAGRTRTAATRTAGTARSGAARTRTATKSTATRARKVVADVLPAVEVTAETLDIETTPPTAAE